MLRQFSVKRIVGFFLIDWLGSLAMLACAVWLRAPLGQLPEGVLAFLGHLHVQVGGASGAPELSGAVMPWPVLIIVAVLWPIIFIIFSIYDGRRNENPWYELRNVFFAICFSMLALDGCLFLTYRDTSRVAILIFFGLDLILLLGARVVLFAYRRIWAAKEIFYYHNVLIVGAGEVGRRAAKEVRKHDWAKLNLVGFLDDDPKKQGCTYEGIPVLGKLDQVDKMVETHSIQHAIIALPIQSYQTLVDICQKLQNLSVRVHVIPDMFSLSFPNTTLDGFGGIPVLDLGLPSLQGMQRFWKRAFDILASIIILVILSPALLVLALWVKLDSPGPVIYRQKRIGENGKPFIMYKFRSMRVDTDPLVHQEYVTRLIKENVKPENSQNGKSGLKMENDPHITRLGHFIRKTSLDELPQFFNVLRGEMSLVGPRPSMPYELEVYQDWHKRRLQALPGMTGIWQVRARNLVSFDEMVRLDLDYIQHQSILRDIWILLQTPMAALSTRGAG
jgi:exopolysaccharide biosynthesis polyprenyl glycosylphosphotransferase